MRFISKPKQEILHRWDLYLNLNTWWIRRQMHTLFWIIVYCDRNTTSIKQDMREICVSLREIGPKWGRLPPNVGALATMDMQKMEPDLSRYLRSKEDSPYKWIMNIPDKWSWGSTVYSKHLWLLGKSSIIILYLDTILYNNRIYWRWTS